MKTMKARLNQMILATFLIVILVGGSVNAQGEEIIIVSGLENIAEPKLEIENWMVNETCWLIVEKAKLVEAAQDESLSLETWMLETSKWQLPVFNYSSDITEQALMLENWMVNPVYWN